MSDRLEITFAPLNADPEPVTVVLAGDGLALARKRAKSIQICGRRQQGRGRRRLQRQIQVDDRNSGSRETWDHRLLVAGLGKTST